MKKHRIAVAKFDLLLWGYLRVYSQLNPIFKSKSNTVAHLLIHILRFQAFLFGAVTQLC